MFLSRRSLFPVAFFVVMCFQTENAYADGHLGELLRQSGWERIIGTWVDEETQGERVTATYQWKIDNRVIETTTSRFGKRSAALIGINAKSGEVFHIGGDSEGGSFLGEWDIAEEGEATLAIAMIDPDGESRTMHVRYELVDNDTMAVSIKSPLPLRFRLVRAASDAEYAKQASR